MITSDCQTLTKFIIIYILKYNPSNRYFWHQMRDHMKILGSGLLASIGAAGLMLTASVPSQAADASWGCQVLLCAASETPSWHGVPYCVPPMQKLIAAMSLPGFSWPICKEGNAGKPGLEPYEPCPEGWSPTSSDTSSGHGSNSAQNVCTRNLGSCGSKDRKSVV